MRWWIVGVFALSGLLGGCFSSSNSYYDAPKPIDKMSKDELCAFYVHYRENPELSQQAKDVATQQARAKGCSA